MGGWRTSHHACSQVPSNTSRLAKGASAAVAQRAWSCRTVLTCKEFRKSTPVYSRSISDPTCWLCWSLLLISPMYFSYILSVKGPQAELSALLDSPRCTLNVGDKEWADYLLYVRPKSVHFRVRRHRRLRATTAACDMSTQVRPRYMTTTQLRRLLHAHDVVVAEDAERESLESLAAALPASGSDAPEPAEPTSLHRSASEGGAAATPHKRRGHRRSHSWHGPEPQPKPVVDEQKNRGWVAATAAVRQALDNIAAENALPSAVASTAVEQMLGTITSEAGQAVAASPQPQPPPLPPAPPALEPALEQLFAHGPQEALLDRITEVSESSFTPASASASRHATEDLDDESSQVHSSWTATMTKSPIRCTWPIAQAIRHSGGLNESPARPTATRASATPVASTVRLAEGAAKRALESAFAEAAPTLLLSGVFVKQGQRFPFTWRRRTFEVRAGGERRLRLSYFEAGVRKGGLELAGVELPLAAAPDEESTPRCCWHPLLSRLKVKPCEVVFTAANGHRQLLARATSEAERTRWMEQILPALGC